MPLSTIGFLYNVPRHRGHALLQALPPPLPPPPPPLPPRFRARGVAGSAFARLYILKPRPLALCRSSILPFKLPLERTVGNSVLPYERPV